MIFKNICAIVLWTTVASALEGLIILFAAEVNSVQCTKKQKNIYTYIYENLPKPVMLVFIGILLLSSIR